MTNVREVYDKAYDTLDLITRGRNHAAHHFIWDDAAALLTGYLPVTYTDIIGSVKSKILDNHSLLEYVYYPGEAERKKIEYEQMTERDKREYGRDLESWFAVYEEFHEQYSLENPEQIGTFWERFLSEKDMEEVLQVTDALQSIHDVFMPAVKKEILIWVQKNLTDEMITDANEINQVYKQVRKLQLERIKLLKRGKTWQDCRRF